MKKLLHFSAIFLAGTLLHAQQNANNFKYLDINRVKAGISCKNQLHWDSITGNAAYEVPQGSGVHSSFATALWFGGIDGGGQLRLAGQTYRQTGVDFWPGPLSTVDASTTPNAMSAYNKVWKVTYNDINNFLTNHVATGDILTWPGNGDMTQNQDPILAPYIDVNTDGYYDPNDGDYPDIKGDQAIYTIFNDNGGQHTATGGNRLGAEIHLMAYAYGCPYVTAGHNELAYTTFYDYKIINRSQHTLNDFYAGLWSDADLGYYMDDYTGCDVKRNLAYLYNGDGYDEGPHGYGNYPPAQGILLLKGPDSDLNDGMDNDHDGCTDCTYSVTPTGTIAIPGSTLPEEVKMSVFGRLEADYLALPTSGPSNASEYYGSLTGYWKDGSSFTCGGVGYAGSVPTKYIYPGNSDPSGPCGTGWTEITAGNVGGDRRIVTSSGPITLKSGRIAELEYAFITSFDSTTANNAGASLQKLFLDADKVKAFYSMPYKPNCYQGAVMGVKETSKALSVSIYPNPAKDLLTVNIPGEGKGKILYEVTDVIGQTLISGDSQQTVQFSIPVAGLANGVYFIRISVGETSSVKKFVKE